MHRLQPQPPQAHSVTQTRPISALDHAKRLRRIHKAALSTFNTIHLQVAHQPWTATTRPQDPAACLTVKIRPELQRRNGAQRTWSKPGGKLGAAFGVHTESALQLCRSLGSLAGVQ